MTDMSKVTDSVLTIRVIKSFPYRIVKNLVLQHVDLTSTTTSQLKELAQQQIASRAGWKVYKGITLDTLKLYTRAHGSKTTNLIINLDHEDWLLRDEHAILRDLGIENESELSFFKYDDYEAFKNDPTEKWI
ncbi:protein of unknown function [Taphrina deformans PYCC 5710]|uniref:Cytoplasmic protein n=1 Tax=Taphrina deformans (strain PYCC 5710 / ATCC 11124 / CBS 356.35 / IMI 108563 / JCM 9778 / NBRC 8474) TaxID=1097556 RepID=R4XFH9_TAPDE|nr:protein of unknown function [Taphrina deformans PYCC 5710]|eukprot:CCG84526.2 protein of unknown function [Taphrina deformans PYCC 5710]